MTATTTLGQEWMDGLYRATDEVARTALAVPTGCVRLPEPGKLSLQMSGAYVALLSVDVQMQIGVAASRRDCRRLAAALLMMQPDDAELTDSVMADALGEIVNILAGALKQKMDRNHQGLTLGLPTTIHGHIAPTERQELTVAAVTLGDIQTNLVLLMNKKS